MALYEVFSKGLSKPRQNQGLQPQPTAGKAAGFVHTRPRAVQFNRGKVEISLRYDVAIVLVLVVLLGMMGAYRLGEHISLKSADTAAAAAVNANNETTVVSEPIANETAAPAVSEPRQAAAEAVASSGDNWIVIATHQNEGQLAPVQQYFAGYGIETQIRQVNGSFILHTKNTFENPNRFGSDGQRMLQRVIELGRNYEPPSGYRSFDFATAYGMKKTN
ncbi:MAG: hypothetical protein WC374_10665 [Phycisphaerae bacterium]